MDRDDHLFRFDLAFWLGMPHPDVLAREYPEWARRFDAEMFERRPDGE